MHRAGPFADYEEACGGTDAELTGRVGEMPALKYHAAAARAHYKIPDDTCIFVVARSTEAWAMSVWVLDMYLKEEFESVSLVTGVMCDKGMTFTEEVWRGAVANLISTVQYARVAAGAVARVDIAPFEYRSIEAAVRGGTETAADMSTEPFKAAADLIEESVNGYFAFWDPEQLCRAAPPAWAYEQIPMPRPVRVGPLHPMAKIQQHFSDKKSSDVSNPRNGVRKAVDYSHIYNTIPMAFDFGFENETYSKAHKSYVSLPFDDAAAAVQGRLDPQRHSWLTWSLPPDKTRHRYANEITTRDRPTYLYMDIDAHAKDYPATRTAKQRHDIVLHTLQTSVQLLLRFYPILRDMQPPLDISDFFVSSSMRPDKMSVHATLCRVIFTSGVACYAFINLLRLYLTAPEHRICCPERVDGTKPDSLVDETVYSIGERVLRVFGGTKASTEREYPLAVHADFPCRHAPPDAPFAQHFRHSLIQYPHKDDYADVERTLGAPLFHGVIPDFYFFEHDGKTVWSVSRIGRPNKRKEPGAGPRPQAVIKFAADAETREKVLAALMADARLERWHKFIECTLAVKHVGDGFRVELPRGNKKTDVRVPCLARERLGKGGGGHHNALVYIDVRPYNEKWYVRVGCFGGCFKELKDAIGVRDAMHATSLGAIDLDLPVPGEKPS